MSLPVALTERASAQVDAVDDWWRANRSSAPELFAQELADALDLLSVMPQAGRRYERSGVSGVRRLVLRATRHHVYYRVDPEQITVLAVWSAVRGRGPKSV